MFAAFNFGDTELKDYELTLPGKGKITPLLNSDWNCFGGRTARPKALRSKTTTGSVKLTLAPYSAQLYRFEPAAEKETKIRLIPYFLWANRAPGEMAVWIRRR